MSPARCPIHGKILKCPACIGAKGGAAKSEKKKAAARKNALKKRG